MTDPINSDTLSQWLRLSALGSNSLMGASNEETNISSSADFSGLFQSLLQYIEKDSSAASSETPVSGSGTAAAPLDLLWTMLSSGTPPVNLSSSAAASSPSETGTTAAPAAALPSSGSPYSGLVNQMAAKYDVDPSLIQSIMETESGGNSQAVSQAGAEGLMQLMPGTARALGVSDTFDPAQNLEGGTKYIKSLLQTFHGNVRLALAAYNSGAANVQKYGDVPPFPETQAYVAKVMNKMGQGTATV
ncbi:MAG: lytic transglycosylase domain-containing protein [Sporolactobacillus sp.]